MMGGRVQAIERTTPPSTRSAAPLVAEAWVEQAYTTMLATSSTVASRRAASWGGSGR